MNHLRSLILFCLVINLISCGSDRPPERIVPYTNKAEMEEAFKQAFVRCAEPGYNCPNNVVRLTAKEIVGNSYGIGMCSGTLFGDEYILTNSHCIPERIKENGANCRDIIKIQFPKTKNGKEENLNCQFVVQAFNDETSEIDLAVLKIDRSLYERDQLTVSGNSLAHEEMVYAYVSTPTGGVASKIERKDCRVSYKSMFDGHTSNRNGSIRFGGDECEIIAGNSGSGIFKQSGELVGAINATFERDELRKVLKNVLNLHFQPLSFNGNGINVSCLKDLFSAQGQGDCFFTDESKEVEEEMEELKIAFGLANVSDDKIEIYSNPYLEFVLVDHSTKLGSAPHSLADFIEHMKFMTSEGGTVSEQVKVSSFKKSSN